MGRTVETGSDIPTVHEVDRPIPGLLGSTRNGSCQPTAAVSVHRMGQVVGLYLAGAAGMAMRPVQWAVAVAGQGLVGDRYQAGTGQWCYDRRLYDDVTLIATEALDAAGAEHGVHLQAGAARRNAAQLQLCKPQLSPLLTSGSSHRNYSLRSSSTSSGQGGYDIVAGQLQRLSLTR